MRFIQIKEASKGDKLKFQDINLNHGEIWRLHGERGSRIPNVGGREVLQHPHSHARVCRTVCPLQSHGTGEVKQVR